MKRDDYDDEGDLVEHNEALAIAKQARQYLLTPIPDPTPGAPVPPYSIPTTFNSNYAQAMQEREELIKLLTRSANMAESYASQSSPSYGKVALDQHAKQCRATAERLGGGGSDV